MNSPNEVAANGTGGLGSFYITGGTLRHDAPSYVERQADRDLYEGLVRGDFCYVLTSRQMGKSSLMVRTAKRLRENGINVVALDLTAIGQNLTPEQWYDGLLTRVGQQLGLEEALEHFWLEQGRLGPVQRLFNGLRTVAMARRPGPLVVFIDEIDTVRGLPFSTDEFFAAIRECYNRRSEDAEFRRLTFCLLGVATPSDLIRDTRTTPFNIGRRIELHDFQETEGVALAKGLNREEGLAHRLWQRIFHWTQGHPYLTQRLCQAVVTAPSVQSPAQVDALCEELFFSPRARDRDDNLIFVRERLIRGEVEPVNLLNLYLQIWGHRKTIKDDETNVFVNLLRLSGIVRAHRGKLEVRNRIYQRVFDERWVETYMPGAEQRRQREAFQRGMVRGLVAAGTMLALLAGGYFWWGRAHRVRESALVIDKMETAYRGLKGYRDTAVFKTDMQMTSMKVTWDGSCQLAMERPNKLNLLVRMNAALFTSEYRILCDGHRLRVFVPSLNQYVESPAPPTLRAVLGRARAMGLPMADLVDVFYGFLLQADTEDSIQRLADQLRYLHRENLDGELAYVVEWTSLQPSRPPPRPGRLPGEPFRRRGPGSGPGRAPLTMFPTTAWISPVDGHIRQMSVDLSLVVTQATLPNPSGSSVRDVPVQSFVTTVKHRDVKLNPVFSATAFHFDPPAGAESVTNISANAVMASPEPLEFRPKYNRWELARMISPRSPQAQPEQVDLSRYFNAPLTEPWHSDRAGNTLTNLPEGVQELDGVTWDIRGIVQLAGRAESYLEAAYPRAVHGIRVGQRCQRLHFLQGAGWKAEDGTHIGNYVVHYADRERRVIPIIYGFDVRDWWVRPDEPIDPTGLQVAWQGSNTAYSKLRLYQRAWLNPRPDVEITTIDFVSSLMDPAPFLLAITLER